MKRENMARTNDWKKAGLHFGIPALFILLLIIVSIRLGQVEKTELVSRGGQTFERGVVVQILQDNVAENGMRVGEQIVSVQMKTGVRKGETVEATSSAGYLFGAPCRVGMRVVVLQSVSGDSTVTTIYSRDRGFVIWVFAILYFALLCLIGGKQGLKGAIGLAFTFFTILFVMIPLIYLGGDPFVIAVLVCLVTTLVTMLLIGGPTRKTAVAVIGTVTGVIIAYATARLFGWAAGLSGLNVSDIESLMTIYETNGIKVGGLLFAGLLISALGATMDVAMSISSAMQEIVTQNPSISRAELWRAGLRVGRDMMGTDSNTLILAFAGTGISTLVLDYAYDLPYLQIINSNNIDLETMQGLSGSFGIVLCVPVTVLIGGLLFRRGPAVHPAAEDPKKFGDPGSENAKTNR
jgi:uncharacterized membrane protein